VGNRDIISGACVSRVYSRDGWMDCRDTFYAVILLCNGQSIAEYEAYWLIGVPIINP